MNRIRSLVTNLRFASPPATLDLRYANVAVIEDDPRVWPRAIQLNGLVYGSFDDEPRASAEERLRWLRLDPEHYRPQPYDQLMTSLESTGDEQGANRVGLEKQRQRRRTLPALGRVLGVVQDVTVGYGFRTWLAGLWIIPLVVVATATFVLDRPRPRAGAPAFQPAVYALDLILPIVDLGLAETYVADGITQWVAWVLVVAGWVLTTAVVAGLTRHLHRGG